MGRIKTRPLKSKAKELYARHQEQFTTDFAANKQVVSKYLETTSKKLRNIIAGYATRMKKSGAKD